MENIKEKEEKRKYDSFYRHAVRSIFPKHLKFYFETLLTFINFLVYL